jgi:hypothetical protein
LLCGWSRLCLFIFFRIIIVVVIIVIILHVVVVGWWAKGFTKLLPTTDIWNITGVVVVASISNFIVIVVIDIIRFDRD